MLRVIRDGGVDVVSLCRSRPLLIQLADGSFFYGAGIGRRLRIGRD